MATASVIRRNLERVQMGMRAACDRARRDPAGVRLVAVTKTVGTDEVRALYDLGVRDFGENRVPEALRKIDELRSLDASWHFIGRLQTNKINKLLGAFALIHSVDSVHLAEALDKRAAKLPQAVLLEVNVSGEASKGGFAPAEVGPALQTLSALANIRVRGLMTMAPLAADPEQARPVFAGLRRLRDELAPAAPAGIELRFLSMGMTQDFEVAIEEGADLIRVGTALFAE